MKHFFSASGADASGSEAVRVGAVRHGLRSTPEEPCATGRSAIAGALSGASEEDEGWRYDIAFQGGIARFPRPVVS
ncbi:hypothetical protein D3C79_949360 [compost metagenome]